MYFYEFIHVILFIYYHIIKSVNNFYVIFFIFYHTIKSILKNV
jgi:hypothetical protein